MKTNMAGLTGVERAKVTCRTCKHRQRWQCGGRVIQYCGKQHSNRTFNHLKKIITKHARTMRTIKFRGQRIDNREWVYGFLYQIPLPSGVASVILTTNNIHEDNSIKPQYHLAFTLWVDLFPVKPETIGLFTGLHDKNGEEIYDGDIIYSEFPDGSKTNCLIGWDEESSCFGLMDEYNYRSKLKGYYFPMFENTIFYNFRKHSKKFEVIGNIHDNPELLSRSKHA